VKKRRANHQHRSDAPPPQRGVRGQAEEALRTSEQRLQDILDNTTAVVFVKDLELRYILVNREYERRHQVQRDQIRGKTDFDIFPRAIAEKLRSNDRQVIEACAPVQFEEKVPMMNGERQYVVVKFPLRDGAAKPYAVCGIATDITEFKRAEEKLAGLNRTLKTLYQCNQALVRATEEYELLQSVCRILVEVGGLRMAWVGYREYNEDKSVRPVAQAGYEAGYLRRINITWADTENGRGPTGTAIRAGTACWTRDNLTDPNLAPWRDEDLRHGYASSISLPLMSQGQAFGALALHTGETDAFTESAIEQYTDLANNLAFGVMALRAREERKRAESEIRQLNASLEKRVAARTIELVKSNDQLKRAEAQLRKRGEQMQIHRDVLLELARSDKSDLEKALQKICSLSARTLEVARVSYWSLQESSSAISCEVLYLRDAEIYDEQFKGTRLGCSDCPAYFEALAAKRPIVADRVLTHPATSRLAEKYLKPLCISSMLDAPVWAGGKVVGVLCHEHTGPPRDWSAEEVDFVSALASMVSLALEESNRARSELQLRESEQKFRALFEGTSQAVVLHDENGIFEANPSWLRLLGYSRLEEVIGKHPAEVSTPIQPGGERAKTLEKEYIAKALADGSARFEWIVLRRDGTEVPIEVFLTPIQLGGRQLIQAVCNDITQRKQAEAELHRTLAREKELGQLRSKFVSMVSHEFRTPLAIIQSSAELMDNYLERLTPSERKDHLQSIRKNTRRMVGLMEEVLLIGSFDAGRMHLKSTPLELRTFLQRLVDDVLSATKRRCQIEFRLPEMPGEVLADERLLRQIFTNVLTNAVKYSDAGQVVKFEIACAGADIVCSIRDRGIGIPEADQEWLFHPFHRGRNVGDRPGTGLGLVIVRRCVDLYGGTIDINSKVGEGTSVTLRLPTFSLESPSRVIGQTA
jgi:PAS domain S-box-containing protein